MTDRKTRTLGIFTVPEESLESLVPEELPVPEELSN